MILMRNPAKFIILCALDSLQNHEKNISLWRKRQLLYTGPLPFEIFSLSHLSCSLYLKFQISWYEMRSSLGKVGYVWYSPGFTLTSEIFSVFWCMFVVYGNPEYKLLSWCGQTNIILHLLPKNWLVNSFVSALNLVSCFYFFFFFLQERERWSRGLHA